MAEAENASTTEKVAADVSYVKGSASMQDISSASGIAKDRLIAKWEVSNEDFEKPIKDVKDIYGFSVNDLKTWIIEETS